MTPEQQVAALVKAVDEHAQQYKQHYLVAIEQAANLLVVWLGYLRSDPGPRQAARLLDGTQAATIEVAAALSLGLVRPALFSMRAQLELMLAWIYYGVHPVEWANVEQGRNDFQMRAQSLKFVKEHGPKFDVRWNILNKKKTRKNEDPYSLLSVHVHGTTALAAPKVGPLATLVQSKLRCDECVQMQAEVAEYLSDLLTCWSVEKWQDLPQVITQQVTKRLTPSELKAFCQ